MEGIIETVVFRFQPDDSNACELNLEVRIVTRDGNATGVFRRDICLAKGISETKVARHLTDSMRGSWRGRGPGGIRTYETVDAAGLLALLPIRPKVRTTESDRRCLEFESFARGVILPLFELTDESPITSGHVIDLVIPPQSGEPNVPTFRPIFDDLMHVDERGKFWTARDLQGALGYSSWQMFRKVVDRAITNCIICGFNSGDHFNDVIKMVPTGDGAVRDCDDLRLTKYACHLVTLAGDSSNPRVAEAKTYFSVMTDFAERSVAIPSPHDGDQIELLLRAALDHRKNLRQLASRVEAIDEQARLRDEEAIRLASQLAYEQDRIKERQEEQERERVRMDELERQARKDRDERELQQQEIDSLREKVESRPASVVATATNSSKFWLVREYAKEHGFTGRRSIQTYHKAIGVYLTDWVDSECFAGRGVKSDYIHSVMDRFLDNDAIMEKPINKYNEDKVFKVKWMDALKACCPKVFFKLFPEPVLGFGD